MYSIVFFPIKNSIKTLEGVIEKNYTSRTFEITPGRQQTNFHRVVPPFLDRSVNIVSRETNDNSSRSTVRSPELLQSTPEFYTAHACRPDPVRCFPRLRVLIRVNSDGPLLYENYQLKSTISGVEGASLNPTAILDTKVGPNIMFVCK